MFSLVMYTTVNALMLRVSSLKYTILTVFPIATNLFADASKPFTCYDQHLCCPAKKISGLLVSDMSKICKLASQIYLEY